MKIEVARFEQERIEDFKASLEALLDGMIARQKEVRTRLILLTQSRPVFLLYHVQLIATWESLQTNLLKKAPQPQQRAPSHEIEFDSSMLAP